MTRPAVLLACFAASVAAGCADDDEPEKVRAPETTTEPAPPPTATTKAPAPKRERRKPAVDRHEAAVQVTLNELVEALELGDQPRACALLGQSGANAEACSARAGVDLLLLPSSEELSPESTTVKGERARLVLASGAVVLFRRSGSKWVVSGLNAP